MKPYGQDKKLKANLTDCHPKKLGKNIVNWWEVTLKTYSKKRNRQISKRELQKILNDRNDP